MGKERAAQASASMFCIDERYTHLVFQPRNPPRNLLQHHSEDRQSDVGLPRPTQSMRRSRPWRLSHKSALQSRQLEHSEKHKAYRRIQWFRLCE